MRKFIPKIIACFLIFAVQSGLSKTVHLKYISGKDVKSVALAGDFTGWNKNAIEMNRKNDTTWVIQVDLKPGEYSYRFILDDKIWIKDPANPLYGGFRSNSLLFVYPDDTPLVRGIDPPEGTTLYHNKISINIVVSSTTGWNLSKSSFSINNESFAIQPLNQTTFTIPNVHLKNGDNFYNLDLVPANGSSHPVYQGLWTVIGRQTKPVVEAGHFSFVHLHETFRLDGGMSYRPDKTSLQRIKWRWDEDYLSILTGETTLSPKFKTLKMGSTKVFLSIEKEIDSSMVFIFDENTENMHLIIPGKQLQSAETIQKVVLAGDFNHWQPDKNWAMKKAGDNWVFDAYLAAGTYEYKLVINDHIWITNPLSTEEIEDGWNGYNSILHIPDNCLCSIPEKSIYLNDNHLLIDKSLELVGDVHPGVLYFYTSPKDPLPVSIKMDDSEFFHVIDRCPKQTAINAYFTKNDLLFSLEHTPTWADTAIIYEIFLREFDGKGKGTFNDVISHIPYLKTLGVNTIWFMPVYEGPTEHGYAPTDFMDTERDYGSMDDFSKMVGQLKKEGFHVLFDFVANHMSDQHPYFRASRNPESIYRDWFVWDKNGNYKYNADWDVLPDLNWKNSQVRHYMTRVALFWQATGIDGFRCDAAWGVPHDYWKDLRIRLKMNNPEFLMIDEVLPRDPSYHDLQFDASYDTDFYGNLLDLMNGKKTLDGLIFGLQKTLANYPPETLDLRYLENHDMPRFIAKFGEDKAILSAVLLFLSPGMPLVYYGQETGLTEMRGVFDWSKTEFKKNKLLNLYKNLISMRKMFKITASNKNTDYSKVGRNVLKIKNESLSAWLNFSETEISPFFVGDKEIILQKNTEVNSGEASLGPWGFIIVR